MKSSARSGRRRNVAAAAAAKEATEPNIMGEKFGIAAGRHHHVDTLGPRRLKVNSIRKKLYYFYNAQICTLLHFIYLYIHACIYAHHHYRCRTNLFLRALEKLGSATDRQQHYNADGGSA